MLVVARWVHFASIFALFGGAFFWFYIDPEHLDGLPWAVRGTTRILRIAGPIAVLSGIAWLVASIANMTGDVAGIVDPETLHAFFFETPFGPLAITRLLLLGAIAAAGIVPMGEQPRCATTALLAALLLVSQAWLGHSAEGGDTAYGYLMIVAYIAHVLAAASWIGGLPPLALALFEQRRRGDPPLATLRILSRYSAMAFAAVGIIVVSGLANTAFRLGSRANLLVTTDYGKILAIKIVLVAIMLALAAFHRFLTMPRLALSPTPQRSLRNSIGSIALETVIGVLVLGAAALLGVTPPPPH